MRVFVMGGRGGVHGGFGGRRIVGKEGGRRRDSDVETYSRATARKEDEA